MAPTKVAVLGGGVGGMSAAHELIERGFDVTVYEARTKLGGKARSIWVPGTGTGGRKDLPGEHGFRFFPGFYKHLPDTMKRIPFGTKPNGVYDNLIQATRFQISRVSGTDPVLLARFPESPGDVIAAIRGLLSANFGFAHGDLSYFLSRLLILLTSCDERRVGEIEQVPWWEFIDADAHSDAYRKFLARGLTRSLVAMRAEVGSTRTVGVILLQLLFDLITPGDTLDRLLDGPTDEVWLTPWRTYLTGKGVVFKEDAELTAWELGMGKISGVKISYSGAAPVTETADMYVAAIPVERMTPLVTPAIAAAAPELASLYRLNLQWMNGIQFFLNRDVELAHGHTIYVDSPYALTSVSQAQFWDVPLNQYGDGTVRGVLSVDVSDWDTPGILYGKPARELATRQEVKDEVWEQIKRSFSAQIASDLETSLVTWFLDDDIQWAGPSLVTNLEPLLVNTAGSLQYRPEATTSLTNLFLAADYVRTYTDLATMEGANEAARRAVNGILDAVGSGAPRCGVWPLEEPAVFGPAKALDKWRWDHGLSHLLWHR